MRNRHILATTVAALALTATLADAVGGPPQVYVADGESCSIAAYADTVSTIIAPHMFCCIKGMSIAADGQILIADSQQGIVRVDPETSEFIVLDPAAVLDPDCGHPVDVYPDCGSGDIYFITKSPPRLRVLPGGSGPSQLCLSLDPHPLDLQVYPTGTRAGHVLVLVGENDRTPPYLAEFERTGPTTFEELPPAVPEAPEDAVAFAIRPDGGIVLLDEETGMYEVGPGGDLTHFGPRCDLGWVDIGIGADGTIYVTDEEAGRTHRFDPNGNWILPSLNCSVESPVAVAAVGFTPSPPGGSVPVTPVAGVELLFEEITDGGYTSATTTETMSRVSPEGNTLPEYAAAPDGRGGFTYVSLATTAVYENLVQVDVLLPGSRLFFAHGTGQVFQDVTVEGTLEDARGVISRFSEVVVVDDTRSPSAVINDKFGRLFEILAADPASRVGRTEWAKKCLRLRAQRARQLYDSSRTQQAIDELSGLNVNTRAFAGTALPNSSSGPGGNLAGEILSRSKTLMYSLSLLTRGLDKVAPRSIVSEISIACASPARGECRFELAGPAGARVTVQVYTAGGRLVRTLHDGVLLNGRETLTWDGTDAEGRPVASGVYLTRVESDSSLATGKVVFIR